MIIDELMREANSQKAVHLMRFFKTGKGEYGEGDKFLGIVVPVIRTYVRKYWKELSPQEATAFVHSPFHEIRLFGLLCWVMQYKSGDAATRESITSLYLKNRKYINNWDLIDLTAGHILGELPLIELKKLASSSGLWDRRIAMLATSYDIGRGNPEKALVIAQILLHDNEDLIHKAVGWMLREVGKRCNEEQLLMFLDQYTSEMPRTMLRYAIERLPEAKRKDYLTR